MVEPHFSFSGHTCVCSSLIWSVLIKTGFLFVAGFALLTACGEPDVVIVEPIEEEGVEQRVISGDGIEAREQVDEVIVCAPDDDDCVQELKDRVEDM